MNGGGIGEEGVVAKRLVSGPEEEAEDEMGIVLQLETNLCKLCSVEAVGTERLEVTPP